MAQRSTEIEEVFKTIAPSRRKGIPNPGTISAGITGNNGDPSSSLSEAAQQIAQLREAFQQQSDLIAANTQALKNNSSSSQGGHSVASTVGSIASSVFGGALGLISPIISGLSHLFGGGSSAPVTLPVYTPPPPVSIGGILHAPVADSAPTGAAAAPTVAAPEATDARVSEPGSPATADWAGLLPPSTPTANNTTNNTTNDTTNNSTNSSTTNAGSTGGNQTTYSPQITIHVNAMDSQSFMDRSSDIASAVREAMLNNHPINGVVTDL